MSYYSAEDGQFPLSPSPFASSSCNSAAHLPFSQGGTRCPSMYFVVPNPLGFEIQTSKDVTEIEFDG